MDALESRFLQYVNKNDDCWLWTGHVDKSGYGHFRMDNATHRSHRVAYILWIGEVPDGTVVHHKCAQKNCVRPDHLQVVTPQENTAEMLERKHYLARIKELEQKLDEAYQLVEELLEDKW